MLIAKGFWVKFNDGKEYTSPNIRAKVWIGHSRGIDRLRFAPDTVQTIALQTKDKGKYGYKSFDEQGVDPLHYQLSDDDRRAIANIQV